MSITASGKVRSAVLTARVIRSDGSSENLGVIASTRPLWVARILHALKGAFNG